MTYIANPIYDVVFKYLMSDERIARTILSALLRMDIVSIEVRPHEYPNSQRDTLSVFRIDFAATVRETDGSTHLVLIELQKTWLETETLRFRQYLGVQYQSRANIDDDGNGLPMVAVYLLGHRVGSIEEPVLYVHHEARNRDGQLVTKGLPDPFVSSLTHDSVIVQIPLLRGQVNTRLDRVLSIFDQSQRLEDDQHTLRIDDQLYVGDIEMQDVIHRLVMAAANTTMRQDMNVEDEYFSVIEKRDTEILMRDHKLAEQQVELKQQRIEIEQQQQKLDDQQQKLDDQQQKLDDQRQKLDDQRQKLDDQRQVIDTQQQLIDKRDIQLRASVQALYTKGLSVEEIADILSMDADAVSVFVKQL